MPYAVAAVVTADTQAAVKVSKLCRLRVKFFESYYHSKAPHLLLRLAGTIGRAGKL